MTLTEEINTIFDLYLKEASAADVQKIADGVFPEGWIKGNTAMDVLFQVKAKIAIIQKQKKEPK